MEKTIDDYIRELKEYKSRSTVSTAAEALSPSDHTGILTVVVTHSKGTFPIENAKVQVFDSDNKLITTELTDISGKTRPITLKTVSKVSSETPEDTQKKADTYNIIIEAKDYVTTKIDNIPVYEGVNTVQQIDMTLLAASGSGDTQTITQSNTDRG